MTRKLSFLKDDRGQSQVELAFSFLAILVFVLTFIEVCSAVYTYVVLSDAANEGLRYAIVHSTDNSFTNDVKSKVNTYAANSFHNTAGMTVTVTCPDAGGGCPGTIPGRVEVQISYPYVPYVSLMHNPPTMHAYAEGRLVY